MSKKPKKQNFTTEILNQRLAVNEDLRRLNPDIFTQRRPEITPADWKRGDPVKPKEEEPEPAKIAELKPVKVKKKSNAEIQMGMMLHRLLMQGEIKAFEFESITVVVGENQCRYTPDFTVWQLDGTLRFIEVKGGKIWEDSIVKFKSAKRQYPFAFWEFHQLVKNMWTRIY